MKDLLEVFNQNAGTNYKTPVELAEKAKQLDPIVIAETFYQYINYQYAINMQDMNNFKVKLEKK